MGRGPPASLRIQTPKTVLSVQLEDGSATSATSLNSALDSADDSDFLSTFKHQPPQKARSLRNMKKLSLNLPSAHSSTASLQLPQVQEPSSAHPAGPRVRRPSIASLPPTTSNPTSLGLHRKEEDGSPTIPYCDGPIQILPGVWLGSEDNARDWAGLMERGIKSILNVAKEVASPFDAPTSTPLRQFVSTPNLKSNFPSDSEGQYHPPHPASGRPGLHYLKLAWSHGQQDLVEKGFPAAMRFTDEAIKERGEGVLIHCQCGISRSATLVIAVVMRAAAENSPSVPPEVWDLKGMQGAYSFVKSKSKWAGPNMSLIYQLLDYERRLDPSNRSPSSSISSVADEEEEWGRRRRMMDETPSDTEDNSQTREADAIREEARALDKAMEDRIVARKSSASSLAPSLASSTGVGMGAAWRSRYGHNGRKRAGSVASNVTNHSVFSEDLMEEDEEQELLNVGGGFDSDSKGTRSVSNLSSRQNSPESSADFKPAAQIALAAPPRRRLASNASRSSTSSASGVPPSAPVWKTSFQLPPPPKTAARATFDLPPVPVQKARVPKPLKPLNQSGSKRRPAPLGILPPVPSSPVAIATNDSEPCSPVSQASTTSLDVLVQSQSSLPPVTPTPQRVRVRTESRKLVPPPLRLVQSNSLPPKTPSHSHSSSITHSLVSSSTESLASFRTRSRKSSLASDTSKLGSNRPHTHHVSNSSQPPPTATQTLFVFPPSPSKSSLGLNTPSTMTLVSTPMPGIPFPTLGQANKGDRTKRRSWINGGAAIPPTPTTACSRVDARGWVGLP